MDPSSSPRRNSRTLGAAAVVLVIVWVVLGSLGIWGPHLMANGVCYRLLGCNSGFFGYDVVVHFVSGIMDATLIVWLMRKYPSANMLHGRFWKDFLVIVSIVALIAVSWEFCELCHDQFRMKVLHENLTVPNRLDQPTNDDTMGDMTFSIFGAAVTACAIL